MVSSRAWFAVAVAGVLGLFYVGAGQRGPQSGAALAQGVTAKPLFEKSTPKTVSVKWEMLSGSPGTGSRGVYRSKIPGGWLVESIRRSGDSGLGVGLAFVPDPEHQWDGNSLP
jgi:hypothetical protein